MMILQALNDYYHRKMAAPDPAQRLPESGLEYKEIPFILELNNEGELIGIKDTRTTKDNKKIGAQYLVPHSVDRSLNIAANLLWDNAEYVVGVPNIDKRTDACVKGKESDYLERVRKMHVDFKEHIDSLPPAVKDDPGIRAVLKFLAGEPQAALAMHAGGKEIFEINPILSFRLVNDIDLVCGRPALRGIDFAHHDSTAISTTCLVTGKSEVSARVHTKIKGVWGAQPTGASIVSFNFDAVNSYGKDQGANAPVSEAATFAYTTALNHLLARGSRQRLQIGDASTVFWAQRAEDSDMEGWFLELVVDGDADEPDAHTETIRALLEAIHSGRFDGAQGQHQFFVLGLAPNAGRVSIRFWQAATLTEIAGRTREWFNDLKIARGPRDAEFPSLFKLLLSTALEHKAANIAPNMAGDVVRSLLSGRPLPAAWFNAAIQRCRAEHSVPYLRAAVIKACLNRSIRHANRSALHPQQEIADMLDIANPSPGYRLGRLFAVLEKAQEEASPGVKATIRERYYGAASSIPVAVFTTLLRLKNHHLSKLSHKGRVQTFERLIGEIVDGIGDFPAHMPLPEQGRFALGYYQQRQALFTKLDNGPIHQEGSAS